MIAADASAAGITRTSSTHVLDMQDKQALAFYKGAFNSSPPGQNGCCFADDIFKCTFMNEKFCILTQIS